MHNISRDLELEKQIDAYIKGKLTEEESQELWEELLQRPDYLELLETELGVKSIIEKRSDSNESSELHEDSIIYTLGKSWKWMSAAAAVAVLVIAINFMQFETNQTNIELAINNIDISSNLASAPVLRSQKDGMTPADSLLNRGFEAAISGDVSKALQMYDEIIDSYPEKSAAVQAYLNKGIIQYNAGDFKNSISSFEQVLANVTDKPVAKEKAYWYMGNAYMNIEELDRAREVIHETYSMDGIYRESAYRILRKLDHKLGKTDFDDFEQQMKDGE